VLSLSGSASAAYADDGNDTSADPRTFVPQSPFTEFVCGFPVLFEPVADNQYVVQSSTQPDGTTIQRITGFLTFRLTNLNNSRSTVLNVSGPATLTSRPDGYLALDGEGLTLLTFSLRNQIRLGVPGIDLIQGHVDFVFDPNVIPHVSFSATGNQTDECAPLA
jgi:hypothetical protein